ncbi:MAG: hypothetical protein GY850_10560 [bacterium]|nr:hypothetical protein [bacterium]
MKNSKWKRSTQKGGRHSFKKQNISGETRDYVQGFGNIGSWAARLLKPFGPQLIAVEDATGAISKLL